VLDVQDSKKTIPERIVKSRLLFLSCCYHMFVVCVLLCFIKPILGNRYERSRGFIVSEPSGGLVIYVRIGSEQY